MRAIAKTMNSTANSINFLTFICNLNPNKSAISMNYLTKRRIYYFRRLDIINSTTTE